jgi:hypothetical protein
MNSPFKIESNVVAGTPYPHVTKALHVNLPAFLTPESYKHYKYSIQDIAVTLASFSAYYIYLLAICLELKVYKGFTKVAYDGPNNLIYGGKAILINRIQSILSLESYNTNCVLLISHPEHVPLLPVIYISYPRFQHILKEYNSLSSQRIMWRGVCSAIPLSELITIHDRSYVVHTKYDTELLLIRVVPEQSFLDMQIGNVYSQFEKGIPCIIDGKSYIAGDECVFIKPTLHNITL